VASGDDPGTVVDALVAGTVISLEDGCPVT
jgi:hypothetical protein